jgi:hypothetical protein
MEGLRGAGQATIHRIQVCAVKPSGGGIHGVLLRNLKPPALQLIVFMDEH